MSRPCGGQGVAHSLFQLLPEPLRSPLVHQEGQAALVAGLPGTVVAEDQGYLVAHFGGDGGSREDVQRRGRPEPSRTLLAAHRYVEPQDRRSFVRPHRRSQGYVLGRPVGAVVHAPGDGDVELAGQVGVFGIADEHLVVLPHPPPRRPAVRWLPGRTGDSPLRCGCCPSPFAATPAPRSPTGPRSSVPGRCGTTEAGPAGGW